MTIIITPAIIKAVAPNCKDAVVWSKVFSEAISKDGGFVENEVAAFLSQTAHESGDFNVLEENLNYSADALVRLWPKRFDPVSASKVARKPSEIANIVYANRLGNGDTASSDGYRYRGRGLIQITGRTNYTLFSEFSGIDTVTNPDIVASQKEVAVASAIWFWNTNIRNKVDITSVINVTKRINGGTNGLADRSKRYVACIKAL